MDLSRYRKGVTAVVGAALLIVAAFAAPGKYDALIQTALAVLTALGVYSIPNES